MPIPSRSNCERRSGVVSMSRFPSGNPRTRLHRIRLFLGLSLVQVAQSQPIDGTPTDVPVPRKISCPAKSADRGTLGIGLGGLECESGWDSIVATGIVRCPWSAVSGFHVPTDN